MYSFTVNSRSGSQNTDACNTCCCESISAKPGETNKVLLNYAPWSAPIGGHGLFNGTAFQVDRLGTAPTPVVNAGFGRTVTGAPFEGDLAPLFPNPDQETPVFKLEALFEAANGVVELQPDGKFTYTPAPLFTGIDRFYWSANGAVAEYTIAVDASAEQPQTQPPVVPPVAALKKSVAIDNRVHIVAFLVAVSPAAVPGDIYRLTVKQGTRDCDGNEIFHISCYDITIGACG